MQFKLFDSLAGGTQIGPAIADLPVTAAQGIFSARLDFGSNAPQAVRTAGSDREYGTIQARSYTTLTPREQVEILRPPFRTHLVGGERRSRARFAKAGGVRDSSQFVQTTDPRLSDARNPPAKREVRITFRMRIDPKGWHRKSFRRRYLRGSIFTDQRLSVGCRLRLSGHRLGIFNEYPMDLQ